METMFVQAIQSIRPWMLTHGPRIILILLILLLLQRFGNILIRLSLTKTIISTHFFPKDAEKQRQLTLVRIFETIFSVIVISIGIAMLLAEFGINTGPLLAGAGVVGIAIGFGAQYVIKDIITGFFIILENQYRVGDIVCLDGSCGVVEDITLRMTILRDLDGTVHHIPNGEVKKTSNKSKHFARVNLDIGIAYDSDLEKVITVVNSVGNTLAKDKEWEELIVQPPQFLRVENFTDSSIVIKILGETHPLREADVTGELRKRIKIAFDKESIEMPFPQRVIHQAKGK